MFRPAAATRLFPLLSLLGATPALSLALTPADDSVESAPPEVTVLNGASEQIRQGGIASVMTAPLIDDSMEEGTVWVRTRTMRARYTQAGGAIYPVFGASSPREWPIGFDVTSVKVGDVELDHVAIDAPFVEDGHVVQPRKSLTEVHHLGLDGIEQTFVFHELPTAGELVLHMEVATDLLATVNGRMLAFDAGDLGHVSYGEAFAVDGRGKSIEISREWTGSGIEFRVPASFVADAALPLTIDPVWATFSNGFGVDDDADPTVIYAGGTDHFLVAWNEYTSAQNLDVYANRYSSTLGTSLEGIGIEITNDSWLGPAAGYSYGGDRALIAAVRNPGSITGAVVGRLLDVGAGQVEPGVITISSSGLTEKTSVDVGGSTPTGPSSAHFCVTWARTQIDGPTDVEYRILESDGSAVTSVLKVHDSNADQIQPAISQGAGDTDLNGDLWHIVWTEDDDDDGRGAIFARGIHLSGLGQLNGDTISVTADALFSHPTVSSLSNDDVPSTNDRAAVVAFERAYVDITSPTGLQTDIFVAILSGEEAGGFTSITAQEDFDRGLQQRRPVISTNGKSFYIAYLEEDYEAVGSGQWDVYLAAGEIASTPTQPLFALGERHVMLEDTNEASFMPDIFSRWEGENNSVSSRCVCVWAASLANPSEGFGEIRGRGFRYLISPASQSKAIGRQYCDANPNSVGAFGGRQSSWMRVLGTGRLGDNHTATALDLPLNSFGYLLVGTTSANQNLPGGSAGRLCVSGSVGRFIGQVQSSGLTGELTAIIDPSALPQPNGPVAASPGERWYFQFWHRDSQGGTPTSNFTNACSVNFAN